MVISLEHLSIIWLLLWFDLVVAVLEVDSLVLEYLWLVLPGKHLSMDHLIDNSVNVKWMILDNLHFHLNKLHSSTIPIPLHLSVDKLKVLSTTIHHIINILQDHLQVKLDRQAIWFKIQVVVVQTTRHCKADLLITTVL